MVLKTPKAHSQYWNFKNFKHRSQKWDVLFKNDQMLWFVQKPNEKLLRFVIIFLWEVIYAHFYNWDSPLDLVLVVYDLIELIIEASLWSKDYFTFDTHPQHTSLSSINAYFICVIVHAQMWCVCSIVCQSNPKRFLSILYVFESDFILSCFKFLFKMHFCVVLQKLVQRHFHEKLATKSFLWKEFKRNLKISFSYREYRGCLTSVSWPSTSREMIFRQKLEKHKFHISYKGYCDCFATKSFS